MQRRLGSILSKRAWAPGVSSLQSRKFALSAAASAVRRKAIEERGAPPSINSILDDGALSKFDGNPDRIPHKGNAWIKTMGCTRRVFLLNSHLTATELEGLAYRVRSLSQNEALNSILVATDEMEAKHAWPKMLREHTQPDDHMAINLSDYLPPPSGHEWHVAHGYDPVALYSNGDHKNPEAINYLLASLSDLAKAIKGDSRSKIPIIFVPHGAINDGGFSLALGSYVMATDSTSFQILNPSRGLTLDPVGLSFLLPRLGKEFDQPAANYPGCALMLALMGFKANAEDMMETGLATHFMGSIDGLGIMEDALINMAPWNQQALIKNPTRYYGDAEMTEDHNSQFRNVAVADLMHALSSYRADGAEVWSNDPDDPGILYKSTKDYDLYGDPSLDFVDIVPEYEFRSSALVDLASTFHHIFNGEFSVVGLLERFREMSEQTPSAAEGTEEYDEQQEVIDVAKDFVQRLERQSPLALAVTYRLLWLGASQDATFESCIERELKAQTNLLQGEDFARWAQHATNSPKEAFDNWKHKGVANVSDDEVAEILEL